MLLNESEHVPPSEGTVTAVRIQKKDPSRVSVDLDGRFAFGISAELAVREGVRVGMRLTIEAQERLLRGEHLGSAQALALAYLSRRERTSEEVRRKLRDASFEDGVASSVVERLRALGYLNDQAYAERYAAVRFERGYGPLRIGQELKKRGVADHVVRDALSSQADGELVRVQALEQAFRKGGRLRDNDERKRKKKVYDHLIRRGYSHEVAREAVEEVSAALWKS